jgi:UPF0716 protein FxsA
MRNLQAALAQGGDPARALFDGAAVLVSGLMLLTPGFLSDAVGLMLLLPPVRRAAFALLRRRVVVAGAVRHPAGEVLEGEFRVVEPGALPPRH